MQTPSTPSPPFLRHMVLASLFLGLLVGCSRRETDSGKLRFAYARKIQYAPQILAAETGAFAKAGVEIESQVLLGGIQCAEALTTGAADMAAMGDVPALIAAASGMPVKIVLRYAGGERMHRIVAGPTAKIGSIADLAGKRIAVQKGSSTYGAFLRFCDKHGLGQGKVTLVDLHPKHMPEAIAANQVDAIVGSEPWPSNVEEAVPGSYEVCCLAGLGNDFPHVLVVSTRFAEAHPEQVRAAVLAIAEAVGQLNENPAVAAATIAKVTGVPAAREQRIIESLDWGARLDDTVRDSLQQTGEFLHRSGRIPVVPDLATVIDPSFLP
ncbi:MAG: aliphatic sulfonate ABC transporter substrate-binding protein [Victivallales bacterium]|nr:aliphatic sulfonate ABC transporter substrate-binding protein [Victivallales bacterium]